MCIVNRTAITKARIPKISETFNKITSNKDRTSKTMVIIPAIIFSKAMAEAIQTTITRKIITVAEVIAYKADGRSQVCGYIHSKFAGRFVQLLNSIILRYLLIDFPIFFASIFFPNFFIEINRCFSRRKQSFE